METKKSYSAIAVLVLLLSISGAAAARAHDSPPAASTAESLQDPNIYTIKEAGLQFEVPKDWKVETKEDGTVVLSIEDGAATLTFVVEDKYELIIVGLKSGLKDKLTEMKSDGEPKQDTHNGMTHISESGTGMMKDLKDVKCIWEIDVLKATKNVTVLTFGIDKVLEAHAADYVKFVNSIKKI
jgi:hypothetical protein